ncbi:DinB family protein [Gordonia sp. OPL2]|uniref:DinB family protein n=1 Tax=Gordonia sp. OPL2 TaxID=2486274 RepID=UPI001655C4AA|nr:DinB family protein [Gordonia sp. OPL2]RPA20093.1 DinB family protein [Gordonia sp. OPL2]
MSIVPDSKNWTWVLDRPCEACGLETARIEFRRIPELIVDNAAQWDRVLGRAAPRLRPNDSTWSPLEYAAHVRDVFDRFSVRLTMMLTEDDPLFENWDQEATAIADRYNEQDPSTVLQELQANGSELAQRFAAVPDTALSRTGRRSDGSTFTVETLGRYFIHDPIHHLFDVTGERFTSNA